MAIASLAAATVGWLTARTAPVCRALVLPFALVALVLSSLPLLADSGPARLPLPIGPPGVAISLAFDPLCGILIPLAAIGVAAAAQRNGATADPSRLLAPLGLVLVFLLAGDPCLRAVAAALVLLSLGAGAVRATLAFVCLALPLAPLASPEAGGGPPALAPPVVDPVGAALLAVLALLCFLLPRRRPDAAPEREDAASSVLPLLGCGIAIRLGSGLGGTPLPLGSWLPVLPLGLAFLLGGATKAVAADRLDRAFAGLDLAAIGLSLAAIGTAALVRGADLPPVAAAALGGGVLMLAARTLLVSLAGHLGSAIASEAGSARLAALGGLAGAAPRLAALTVVPLAGFSLLPPFAGFAPLFLLAGTLTAAVRQGGLPLRSAGCLVLALVGLAVGLLLAAVLRLVCAVLLGRPRTPRGAAAVEPAPATLRPPMVLACLLVALSVLPGLCLRAAAPALRAWTGTDMTQTASWLSIGVLPNGVRFSPLLLLAALGLAPTLFRLVRRRVPVAAPREVPAWDDGAPPPPDWLPFGDPLAQAQASTLAAGPAAILGLPSALALRRMQARLRRNVLALAAPLARLPALTERHVPVLLVVAAFAALGSVLLGAPAGPSP